MARALIIGKMIATALLESFLCLSLCSCISSFLFDHDGKSKNNQAFTDINESTRRDPQDLVVRYLDIVKFSPRCSQCCSYIPVEPAIGITGSALLIFTYITKMRAYITWDIEHFLCPDFLDIRHLEDEITFIERRYSTSLSCLSPAHYFLSSSLSVARAPPPLRINERIL